MDEVSAAVASGPAFVSLVNITLQPLMNLSAECPPDLIYGSDEQPGYSRRRCGRGFRYLDEHGAGVTDPDVLERIKAMVLPPMWRDIWICKQASGHLQATGIDGKGRKQYVYHPVWVAFRQQHKFTQLRAFGEALPAIRARVEKDIRLRSWTKPKVLALVVMVLDNYLLRIGNAAYEKQNQTYGVTTLKREHLIEEDGATHLAFKAKSGKFRKVKIHSKRLTRLIKSISELPGHEIFDYLDENGCSQKLTSHDVNHYLQEITGQLFSAKNFRTWGGTVLAIEHYEEAVAEVKNNPRLKTEKTIVGKVAKELGNTVSVCREYYIHPLVLQTLLAGDIEKYRKQAAADANEPAGLSEAERTALKIIACA